MNKEFYRDKAALLKAMGHPVRLCILQKISREKINVNSLVNCLECPQPTVSRHLAKLRELGIIRASQEKNNLYYSIQNPLIQEVLKVLEQDFLKKNHDNTKSA